MVEPLEAAAAGLELDVAKPATTRPKGIRSCGSFTWAQEPLQVFARFAREGFDSKCVIDEYARTWTGQAFMDMLENSCPIRFRAVGEWFS